MIVFAVNILGLLTLATETARAFADFGAGRDARRAGQAPSRYVTVFSVA